MSKPYRWVDPHSDADALEREVMASGLDAAPPPQAQDQVWKSLLLAMGPGGPGGSDACGPGADRNGADTNGAGGTDTGGTELGGAGHGGPTVPSSSVWPHGVGAIGVAKSFAVGLVGGALLLAVAPVVMNLGSPEAPVPSLVAPVQAPSRPGAGPRRLESELPTSRPPNAPPVAASGGASASSGPRPAGSSIAEEGKRASAGERESAPAAPGEFPAESAVQAPSGGDALPSSGSLPPGSVELAEEVALIRGARSRMQSGDYAGATTFLNGARMRFPGGMLAQEREALVIEILERTQRSAEAKERARAFIQAYPGSPHAAKLERLTK